MKLPLKQVLDRHDIKWHEEGNRHCRPGWIQVCCPYCQDEDFHMGFSLAKQTFNCFKCGKHERVETLALLCGVSEASVLNAIKELADSPEGEEQEQRVKRKAGGSPKQFRLPHSAGPLLHQHRNYLLARNFDPDEISKTWGILGTGPIGAKWKNRIIIPVLEDRRVVTFQARDITGKAQARYLSCPDEESITPIKQTVYGLDEALACYHGDQFCVVVEGPTKVWRLGPPAVCTFSASVTTAQTLKIAESFHKVVIWFDADEAGVLGSRKLATTLAGMGVQVWEYVPHIYMPKDPGDLGRAQAKRCMEHLREITSA